MADTILFIMTDIGGGQARVVIPGLFPPDENVVKKWFPGHTLTLEVECTYDERA